jgi:hypothetical protein
MAGFPDSPVAFNPLNPHIPPEWKNPLRVDLYQCVVEPTDGRPPMFVGPALEQGAIDEFVAAIKDQIARGNEREWSNPTALLVRPAYPSKSN